MYQYNIIKKIKKDYKKKKAREKHQNFSKEEKEKNWQCRCECCKNLSEDEKQKLLSYRKKHYRMRKKSLL